MTELIKREIKKHGILQKVGLQHFLWHIIKKRKQ